MSHGVRVSKVRVEQKIKVVFFVAWVGGNVNVGMG